MTDKPQTPYSAKAFKYALLITDFHRRSCERSREYYRELHHKSNFSNADYKAVCEVLDTIERQLNNLEKHVGHAAKQTLDYEAGGY